MAAGSSGQDEVVRLGVETSVKGVKESIDSLKDLSKQLSAIDKQLKSGLNVQGLSEKFSALAKDFEKVSKSVLSGTSDSSKSIDNLTNRVKTLQKQFGIGFVGDSKDKAKLQAYQQKLDSVGVTIMGGAKTVGMMVSNQRRLNEAFKSTALTGMATRASIDAVTEGGKVAFMQPIKRADQFKLQLSALRKDLLNVTQTMQSAAKDRQWIGRQMIEGITLPIAGIGTVAVRSFMAVQSEMIQLKKVTEFGAGTESADAFYDSLVNGANGIREMSREFGVSRKSATALFKEVAALGVDGEQNIKDFANAVSEVAMVGEVDTSTAMQFFRTMNAIFAGGKTDTQGLADTRDLMAQMSAVADETSLQLNDLAAAFPEVAPVMKQMGFSAAGVAASLAGMYKRGIPATEAAHGLKFALQRLVSPTKDSQELIDKMGFSFFDAAGNVKKADLEIMAMAKNLEEGMSAEAASKALGELFGLRQSARMKSFFQDVNIGRRELELFAQGSRKAEELTSDYARGLVAAGFGAKNATGPMDRYNKALEEIKKDPTTGLKRLRAAFDDFKVQLGATIAPAVLTVGEQLTKLLDLFTNLPKSVQIAAVGFAGFIAALGPIRFAAAQATHAIASLGQVGAMFLPRMGEIISSQARLLTAGGPGAVMQVGDKFASKLSRMDRLRTKFGLKTSVEKAAQTVAGGSALAPETAATASLTSAKQALEAASIQVAAAEAAETAAHNSNTAAMTAQAAAINKGVVFDQKILRWRDLNTGSVISQTKAIEQMTAAQLAQYNIANKTYNAQAIANAKKGILAQYMGKATPKASAGAVDPSQIAFVQAMRAREAARLSQLPPPPTMRLQDKLGIGAQAGGVRSQFAELYAFANAKFFTPVGNAAGVTKKKLLEMVRAGRMSSVGQAIGSAGAATFGAFGQGKSGALSGVAGAAASAKLGGVGKIFGNLGKVFGMFTGNLKAVGGPLGTIISLFLKFNKVTVILTIVVGIISFIIMMFKGMKANWEAVMAKIKPGIDAIKEAFGRLKEVFKNVFDKMMGIFGQLGSGAEDGKSSASTFEGIAQIIGDALSGIGKMIDWLGSVIEWLWPFFERTAYIIKDVVGFISALIHGDWKNAFMFLVATVYESVRPIAIFFDLILKTAANFVADLLDLISTATGWIPWLGDAINGAKDALRGFGERGLVPWLDENLRTGLGGIFGPGTTGPAKNKAKDAGGEVGQTLGDAINSGAADAADGAGWVKDWIAKVVEQIDKQIEKVRESAMAALEKAQEAALKVYDDRIKAIEDQEKAEEKLYKTEEYLSNKREMLAKRNLDNQNYQKDRALAIYEGRFNDARMLDIQERVAKQSFNKDIGELEKSRSNDLLKESRDLMKEQINIEKDAAKERFDIQKKAFEDYLDAIFEMTPVTVEQFQSMMDQINIALEQNGAKWPGYAETAMSRMADALRKANKSVINEFNRSENNPLLQWVAAFAEPEVVAILKAGLSKASGGGSGMGTSGGTPVGQGAGITMDKKDAYGLLLGKSTPEGWNDMSPEKKSEFIKKAEEVAGVPEAQRGKTMPGSEHFKMMEAEYAKVEVAEKKLQSIRERSIALYGEEQGVKKNNLSMAEKIATSWGAATTVMKNNNIDFYNSSTETFRNVGSMGSVQSNKIEEVWDKTTNTLSYATDEFGNKWTMTQNGMVNQFGESGRVIQDESGRITSIQVDNAGKVMQASKVSYQLANAAFQEMIAKGIKPGTEEAAKYEQRIKGLGYQAAIVNGQQVLIAVDADDSSARAVLGRLYRLISETNRQVASDPEQPLGRRITANIKASLYDFVASSLGYASGGLVKAQKNGIIANIGEGGFDEYVITTDPKYRASNLGYLAAAASKLGVKMASGAAIKAASGGMFTSSGAGGSSAEYAAGMGGDVYINVDTFIGEEQWFAEMANKYNMKTVPRQRKIEGQQKRVVSSYNDRYRLR